MNIVVIIFTAMLSIVCQLSLYSYYAVGMSILLLFTSFLLLWAIYTIWDKLQGLEHTYVNEKLIHVKVISFFTYTVIMILGYGMLLFIAS